MGGILDMIKFGGVAAGVAVLLKGVESLSESIDGG
jgi:hypothetical protein